MKIKIFYNQKYITTSTSDYKSSKNQLKTAELTSKSLTSAEKVITLFDSFDVICITDLTTSELLDQLKGIFKHIYADGGVVCNERDEFLMIYRNGKWDLPKGKREKSEDSRTCAFREVTEECGVVIDSVDDMICQCYHLYPTSKHWIIKTTTWYGMKCDSSSLLTPQTEEGITEIRWADRKEVDLLLNNSYANIVEVFRSI